MLDSNSQLSPYEQWKIEEDERFYAMFPQARLQPYNDPGSFYLDSGCCQYNHPLQTYQPTEDLRYPAFSSPFSDQATWQSYDSAELTSELRHAIVPSPIVTFQSGPPMTPDQATFSPSHRSEPCPTNMSDGLYTMPEIRLQEVDHTYDEPISFHTMSSSESVMPETPILAHATEGQKPPSSGKTPRQHTRILATRPNPYPRTTSPVPLPLNSLDSSSKRHLRKPPLACHFCRGRKIACGAPDPSNPDRTCNQCERRSLTCTYPSESRRGMRKKKMMLSDALGAEATKPKLKAKVGRKPKASS